MEEVPDAARRKKGVIDKLPFEEHTNTASNGTNAVIREFSSPRGRKDGVDVSSGKVKKANALVSGGKENKPPATPWSKTPEYRRQYQAQYRAKKKAELSTPGAHSQSKLPKFSSASEILDLTIESSVIPGDVKLTGESTVVQGNKHKIAEGIGSSTLLIDTQSDLDDDTWLHRKNVSNAIRNPGKDIEDSITEAQRDAIAKRRKY
ncbi:hypothetical protein EJB05_13696 [Eragrostis curvula]|uniref:Uncharacterized protein n=1 Tax=Eragrostis curvula TaxID=38414 RepID=A0A5J9VWY7_9POAL|nr:hypothetical protein EJB05_13696 [Eragrostis curvula]